MGLRRLNSALAIWAEAGPNEILGGRGRQEKRGALNAKAAPLWGPLRSLRRGLAYLNRNSAVWTLPSSSLSVNVPHLPFQLLTVFQT